MGNTKFDKEEEMQERAQSLSGGSNQASTIAGSGAQGNFFRFTHILVCSERKVATWEGDSPRQERFPHEGETRAHATG